MGAHLSRQTRQKNPIQQFHNAINGCFREGCRRG